MVRCMASNSGTHGNDCPEINKGLPRKTSDLKPSGVSCVRSITLRFSTRDSAGRKHGITGAQVAQMRELSSPDASQASPRPFSKVIALPSPLMARSEVGVAFRYPPTVASSETPS